MRTKITRIQAGFLIFAAAILIEFFLHLTHPLGEDFWIITDLSVTVTSFAAFLVGVYAFRLFGIKSMHGKAMLFLAAGSLFWFLGELSWAVMEVILFEEVPIVSVADIFWLLGYPFFFAGAFLAWKTFRNPISGVMKILIAVVSLAIFVTVTVWGIIPVLSDSGLSLIEFLVTGGYVFADLFLLMMFIVLILSFWGGKFARPWMFIALGIILTVTADMIYFYLGDLYMSGSVIDVLWDLDYILTAFGFFYYRESVADTMRKAVGMRPQKRVG